MKINKTKNFIQKTWVLPAVSLLAVLYAEVLLRFSFGQVLLFVADHPLLFIFNWALSFGVACLSLASFGRYQVCAGILFVVSTLLGVVGRIKYIYRQTGPTIWDLSLLKEAQQMSGALPKHFILFSLLFIAFFAAIFLLVILKSKKGAASPLTRLCSLGIVTILAVCVWFWLPGILSPTQNGQNQRRTVLQTGSYNYFFATLNKHASTQPNNNASSATLAESLPDTKAETQTLTEWFSAANTAQNGPDIIFVQSESFFDPTVELSSELFSKDPLPFFHQLQQQGASFSLATPAYGGDTVSAEFEVLTGLQREFFAKEANIYDDGINRPLASLGWILRVQGYNTVALHPFQAAYYGRQQIFSLLGFNAFLGIDELMQKPGFMDRAFEENDLYANDLELTLQIILQLEESNDASSLVFAISMQNHIPYAGQHPGYEVEYLGEGNKREVQEFSNYLSGLHKTDEALRQLVEYLKTREKETILVFYGDHRPALEFFLQTDESEYNRYQVPAVVWSNKGIQIQGQSHLDMATLPTLVTQAAGLSVPPHWALLLNLHAQGLTDFTQYYATINGKQYASSTPEYRDIYTKLQEIKTLTWEYTPQTKG
ncbi:MAG: LTA synthase family protein [Oscillospiraceae bacterium]